MHLFQHFHIHIKTPEDCLKCSIKASYIYIYKPNMFRPLFQDHLQGSSFALSAPTTLHLHALPFVCIGMCSYALYLYVYPVYVPVCCLVVLCTIRQHTAHVGFLYIDEAW
jgi:hypothetical protein